MVSSKFMLADRVAIVTGSGSGMGKSEALTFAENGAHVVVAGITVVDRTKTEADLETVASKIRAVGRKALVVPTDVRVPEQVANMVEKTMAEFGRIDILVNNVGGTFWAPFLEISEGGWDAVIRTNLKSVFLCCKAVGAVMVEQKRGSVINISSVSGLGSAVNHSHYGAAKAGVINLTQTLSVEWAPHNIRVNAIAPGTIITEGNAALREGANKEKFDQLMKKVPMGRPGQPEEVAAVALFLASDASSYITGQVIRANGGEKGFSDM